MRSAVIVAWSGEELTVFGTVIGVDQCSPPSVDLLMKIPLAARVVPASSTAYRSPFGANESHGSPAPMSDPPEQTVNGMGTCCQVLPPSSETPEMTSWIGPHIQEATLLFGFTEFTAMDGALATLMAHVPVSRN